MEPLNTIDITAGLVLAVAGAALLAALAFRQLIGSVIQLNTELQNTLTDRQEVEDAREALSVKVAQLESQIAVLETKLDAQALEIQALQTQLHERDALIESLQQ